MAKSGHGASIERAKAATPTVWEEIADVGDITWPGFSRNEFDVSNQNNNIDAYKAGMLRRDPFTFEMMFDEANGTHDHLTGLLKAIITEPPPIDGYRITFPAGLTWVASGQCQAVNGITTPVDGIVKASVTIRFSGPMLIGCVVVGA